MKTFITLGLVLVISACAEQAPFLKKAFTPDENQVKAAQTKASYDLRDPSSAQFRNIRGFSSPGHNGVVAEYICGEINGKNAMGGYTGFTPFAYIINTDAVVVAEQGIYGVDATEKASFDRYC